MPPAIFTENLGKRYRNTEALHGLNLEIPEGQCVALLGPNGAGKSTTLKLLMNLATPSEGWAAVLGRDSRTLAGSDFQRIGYVSENQDLPLWMTVEGFMRYLTPFYPKWDRDFCQRLLRDFDIDPTKKLKHLSRGTLMKTALIASIAFRPKLLLLDEPFSGLDPLVREEFVQGVLEIASDSGWTVLLASHDIHEVERLADSVALLNGGRLALHESADELRGRFRRVEVNLPDETAFARLHDPPATWLQIRNEGRRMSFIDSQFSDEGEGIRRHLGEAFGAEAARHVEILPLSLREIFLILAREFRQPQTDRSA